MLWSRLLLTSQILDRRVVGTHVQLSPPQIRDTQQLRYVTKIVQLVTGCVYTVTRAGDLG